MSVSHCIEQIPAYKPNSYLKKYVHLQHKINAQMQYGIKIWEMP
jgi:hypothetical protein